MRYISEASAYASFENELGNIINMRVSVPHPGSLTVVAEGPNSKVEHVWTLREAEMLEHLINQVISTVR